MPNSEYNEEMCDLFVRCFLLPREAFIKSVLEHTYDNDEEDYEDGTCVDIEAIADQFGVNPSLIIKRGQDLLGWI